MRKLRSFTPGSIRPHFGDYLPLLRLVLILGCCWGLTTDGWAGDPQELVRRQESAEPLTWEDGSAAEALVPAPRLRKQSSSALESFAATRGNEDADLAQTPLVWSADPPANNPPAAGAPFPRVRYQGIAPASVPSPPVGTGQVRPAGYHAPVAPYSVPEASTAGYHGPHDASCQCPAHAPPLGSALYGAMQAQVARGRAAGQVLYRYDFENGPLSNRAALNRYGRLKLRGLLQRMELTGAPLYIEHVAGDRQLSEARRRHVIHASQTYLEVPLDPSRVVITAQRLPYLRATDATEIQKNQVQTTRSQGAAPASLGSGANPVSSNSRSRERNPR